MYNELSSFINRSHERRFNDSIMRLIITEIKLQSGEFNEEMILPRYFNKPTKYNGEVYSKSAAIKELMPKKAIEQAKNLVAKGSSMNLEITQIANWIVEETEINKGSVAALWE